MKNFITIRQNRSITQIELVLQKNSNIFGQINFKPIKNISLGYNFSLSNDLNTLEYNSLVSEIEYENFNC